MSEPLLPTGMASCQLLPLSVSSFLIISTSRPVDKLMSFVYKINLDTCSPSDIKYCRHLAQVEQRSSRFVHISALLEDLEYLRNNAFIAQKRAQERERGRMHTCTYVSITTGFDGPMAFRRQHSIMMMVVGVHDSKINI